MTEGNLDYWKERADAAETDRSQLAQMVQSLIDSSRALLKEIGAGLDWNAELPAEPSMARELMLCCRTLDAVLNGTTDNEPVVVLQRRYDYLLEDRQQHILTWNVLGRAIRSIAGVSDSLIPRESLGWKVVTKQLDEIGEFLLGPPPAPKILDVKESKVGDQWAVEVTYQKDAGARWAMRVLGECLGEALKRPDGSFWNSIEGMFHHPMAGDIVVTAQRKNGKTLSQQKKEAEDQLEIAKTALNALAEHLDTRADELGRRLSAPGRVGSHISASEGQEITEALCCAVDIMKDVKKKLDL